MKITVTVTDKSIFEDLKKPERTFRALKKREPILYKQLLKQYLTDEFNKQLKAI